MSGFGSGFGSNRPTAPPPIMPSNSGMPNFGTPMSQPVAQQQQQQQQQFGVPSSSQGFGSSLPTANSGDFAAGGGFGMSSPATAASSFGSIGGMQQQAAMGNVNSTPFGGGTPSSGFGNLGGGGVAQFGTTTSNNNAPSSFGASMSSAGFGSSQQSSNMAGFGGGQQAPFGTAATPSSFGQQSTTSFAPATSFGSSSNTTFGNSATIMPLQQQQQQQTLPGGGPNPFGAAAAATPASSISFGVSSNTVAPTRPIAGSQPLQHSSFGHAAPINSTFASSGAPSPAFGTSSSTTAAAAGLTGPTGFGNVSAPPLFGSSSTTTFGASSSAGSFGGGGGGGGMQSNDNEMMDGSGGGAMTNSTSSSRTPFAGTQALVASSPWPSSSNNNSGTTSPIPTAIDIQGDSSMSPTPPASSTNKDDELAQLKAKKAEILRKKKKKLEELKRRKQAAEGASSSTEGGGGGAASSSTTLNASAPSFVPTAAARRHQDKSSLDRDSASGNTAATTSSSSSSLADRNAARFAKPDTDDALLPEDLRNHSGQVASGYKQDGRGETQDIDNAVSLVGTCPYMCPDDELIRRQKEGDIQLLETPLPGTIHPNDWTLRNTAVKRFRRSAADYKLDVPAWVRPPDVLETVCGYLEEWVMERDRQGPDPRFPQSESPPSLDVYQFIWDRTRMVRKDFTLQNYVGTGGNCDARAVRCHERIARWHAMCEHQLSHIPEFVNAQSQQNMQEFGQAMKTLNMYYDDSLKRATVEVPDEEGNETRTDLSGTTHGCTSQLVMGKDPVDFDGAPLKNDAASIDVSKRLIGPQSVNRPAHGTAEPEMRGLYILTIMNNDNGMEVKAYATHLLKKFPEVYHSLPVQLALSIFKARKMHNYAKFFSILRDPETPYLFACVMFKHVEAMRKFAFRIMSRAYGGRTASKQSMEDKYPLPRLVRLLCFEDDSEALESCRFYNITVEESQSSSKPSIVYWKRSSFREPKDPEKGFALTLKPRKMTRTIESKLKGATRLAVCRGEVSGKGAALSSVPHRPALASPSKQSADGLQSSQTEQQQQMDEQSAKRKMEERRRVREEQKRAEQEKRKDEEAKRKQQEEAERQALIAKKQKEEDMKKKRAEEEKRKKKQVEEERRRRLEQEEANKRAAEAAARAEQLRREAEEKRLAAERAEALRKAEAERLERLRQEELRKRREEEERLERIRREEEEKKRREEAKRREEEERRRQEQLRLQREREEQERRRREEEARRIAQAREAKMNEARKLLIWRRLRRKLDRELRRVRTRQSLNRIDPTFSDDRSVLANLEQDALDITEDVSYVVGNNAYADVLPGIYVLDSLSREHGPPINLAAMLREAFLSRRSGLSLSGTANVILAKIAVVLPTFVGTKAEAMRSLMHSWIGRKLSYRHVMSVLSNGGRRPIEFRTVVSNDEGGTSDCDMVLFAIPPFFGDDSQDPSSVVFPQIDGVVSRAIVCLDNGENVAYAEVVNQLLSSIPSSVPFIQVGDELLPDLFDATLEESCVALLQSFSLASAEDNARGGSVVRLSLAQLGSKCIRGTLWRDGIHPNGDEENSVLACARETLLAMLMELESLSSRCDATRSQWRHWPAREFANERGIVPDYFGQGFSLPLGWKQYVSRSEVEPTVMELYTQFDACSFRDVIHNMTVDAPEVVKEECREMLARRHFRRCFEYVLIWRESVHKPSIDETVVYLPKQSVGDIVEGCVRRLSVEDQADDDLLENAFDQVEHVEEMNENSFAAVASMQACRSPAIGTAFRLNKNESFPLADDQVSDSPLVHGSQPLADSSRTPDSNILSPPAGVETPASPSAGVQTPMTLPHHDFLSGSKRGSRDYVDSARQTSKRQRGALSKNQKESMAFTKRLEAMLHGETLPDVKVGDKKLSDLLRNAPTIEMP